MNSPSRRLEVQLQMHELEVSGGQLNLFDAPTPVAESPIIDGKINSPEILTCDDARRYYAPPRLPRGVCGGLVATNTPEENGVGCQCVLPNLCWQSSHLRCATCFGSVPVRRGHTLLDPEGQPVRNSSRASDTPHDIARLPRSHARSVPVRVRADSEEREPFDLANIESVPTFVAPDEAAKHDRLLQWMSLAASASVAQLAGVAAVLGLEEAATQPMQWLRRARMLGHAEITRDGARFAMAPPVLLQLSATALFEQSNQWIWCGGRDAELLQRIERHADLCWQAQPGAPSRLLVRCDDMRAVLASLRAELEPHRVPLSIECAGETMAGRLPNLSEWARGLTSLKGVRPDAYDLRHWQNETWREVALAQRYGFYELWPRSEGGAPAWETRGTKPKFHALRDGANWRSCSWYDGRFASRILNGEQPRLGYDAVSQRLIMPLDWRPPEPFERVLTLCSGLLPQLKTQNGARWLLWEGVPPALASRLKQITGAPISSF